MLLFPKKLIFSILNYRLIIFKLNVILHRHYLKENLIEIFILEKLREKLLVIAKYHQ